MVIGMLALLYIFFFLVIFFLFANFTQRNIVQIIPIIFSVFLLLLYILAFFNQMWLSDYIILCGAFAGILVLYKKKLFCNFVKQLLEPSFLIFCIVVISGMVLLSSRGISSFDDWNFWAVDIKSIYCLQGYADKGFNCAPSFGDYPPLFQLAAAWLMHILGGFKEGLIMSCYFLVMQIYMAPLLMMIPKKVIVYCSAIILMYTIFTFAPDILVSYSPDVLMATIYGCSLIYIFEKKPDKIFPYIDIAILLSALTLTKSIGIQWVIFALVYMLGLDLFRRNRIKFREIICVLMPAFTWISWYLFCEFSQRTTYLTENMKYGLETGFFNSELFITYGKQLFISFIHSLLIKQQSGIFNMGLSIIACVVLFVIIVRVFYHYSLLDYMDYRWLLIFIISSSILEYGILLFSVETMFIGEYGQYTDPNTMLLLVKRYGAPLVVGITELLIYILFARSYKLFMANGKKIINIWLLVTGISIILTPWNKLWERYVSYRFEPDRLEQSLNERVPEIANLVTTINAMENPSRQKLLLFTDEDISIPIQISYYSVPVSILIEKSRSEQIDFWREAVNYYNATSICFVSNDPDWGLLESIYLEDGRNVLPNCIYYIDNISEESFQLSENYK